MARADAGTNKLVWWIMGIIGAAVSTVLVLLLNGAAAKISSLGDRVGTHAERITKVEARVDALETRVSDLNARLIALEAKLDRRLNPRPWETGRQPQRSER